MSNSSEKLFEQAQRVIPGGVNSPVRAFKSVGGTPLFIKQANGSYIEDIDDKRYIDYVLSWGPMILGHTHPDVIHAVQQQVEFGLSFGAPTPIETEIAEEICKLVPSMDLVRMVSSGTEATMSALRLARGYTNRNKIIKFEGCYHGHSDSLLVKAGSGALTFGVPSSPGVPADLVQHTLTLPYNDIETLKEAFKKQGNDVACVIVEPVAGNMNCIPPVEGFLETLRSLCSEFGALLIFDEVMTGFRVALGGAQEKYGVEPDLTCLGKVVGGGMPAAAFGGRRDIMEQISPLGPVYQAGTLSGNPIAMIAGLTTLRLIQKPGFYDQLEDKVRYLLDGFKKAAGQAGIPLSTNSAGSMFGFFFSHEEAITNFNQVMASNSKRFNSFFHKMLERGVYLAPSSFEAGFMSIAHTQDELDFTINQAKDVFSELAKDPT